MLLTPIFHLFSPYKACGGAFIGMSAFIFRLTLERVRSLGKIRYIIFT
jgi:hypothetical protein